MRLSQDTEEKISMSNIAKAFENGKAFIPFITCGDPDLETTISVVKEAARAGADLIELGIPFSDPTAEGPVIQAASARALAAGLSSSIRALQDSMSWRSARVSMRASAPKTSVVLIASMRA